MRELFAILAVGLGTYLTRAVLILSLADRTLPDVVLATLRYVAPAVLASLVVAMLIDANGEIAIGVAELGAFVLAGVVAHRTRNHVFTLMVGMAVYWLVRAST